MTDPANLPPPPDGDPREDRLRRQSRTPAVPVGLVIGGLILLAAAVYIVSALL